MAIRSYCVTLDEEIVEKAKMIFYKQGIKLSSLFNQYLEDLVAKEESKKHNTRKKK